MSGIEPTTRISTEVAVSLKHRIRMDAQEHGVSMDLWVQTALELGLMETRQMEELLLEFRE